MKFKPNVNELFQNPNIFSNPHSRAASTSNLDQLEISPNPTNIQRHVDLARTRINEEISDIENPPSYFELEMQHILPTYEEANNINNDINQEHLQAQD